MKKLLILFILTLGCIQSEAQLGNFGNKLKNAAKNKAEDKSVDKTTDAVDKGFDSIFKKKKKDGDNGSENQEATTGVPAEGNVDGTAKAKPASIASYSRFDFIPGERTIYAEDFSQDAIGELPLTWNTTGKGEVMTIEGKEGKWLRGYQNNMVLSGNTKKFGENYTIEFDLVYYFNGQPHYSFPDLAFGVFSSRDLSTTDNSLLNNVTGNNMIQVDIHPHETTRAYVQAYHNGRETFHSDLVKVESFWGGMNTTRHYSIQVQKTRFRFWLDEQKLFDVPRGVNAQDTMNQFFLKMYSSSFGDEQVGYYISNIKIATGLPDTRHKLIEEGKFSTTGILFAVNSASIKPESYAVVKEIGTVLKENPAVRIRINGHTSSDGTAKGNLELSRQRAAAVKAMLVKDFGITDDRMETEGKGDREPVGDNKTQEGRVQNRRVEFIKL